MRKLVLTAVAVSALVACKKETTVETTVTDTDTTAVATEEVAPAPAMDSAAMMKAWGEYMTPGDVHKMLADDNGTWNVEMLMWMPGSPEPSKYTSTATSKMILGGRYQETRYTGMMDGQPFEGISTVGYNNASKMIESTWVDNMGTGVMMVSGTWDDASKTMKLAGEMPDPMNNGKMKKFREEFSIVDANTRKMLMFDQGPDGKEYKSMELTMTRK